MLLSWTTCCVDIFCWKHECQYWQSTILYMTYLHRMALLITAALVQWQSWSGIVTALLSTWYSATHREWLQWQICWLSSLESTIWHGAIIRPRKHYRNREELINMTQSVFCGYDNQELANHIVCLYGVARTIAFPLPPVHFSFGCSSLYLSFLWYMVWVTEFSRLCV